jgi:hypothetical protein
MKNLMFWALWLCSLVVVARSEEEPHQAIIVRREDFTNQSQAIPPTAVYTPQEDGVFRVSVVEITTGTNPGNEGSTSEFCGDVTFTDSSGSQQDGNGGIFACMRVSGSLTNTSASQIFIVQAKANTPINFTTYIVGNAPSLPYSYAAYVIVERLA